jgi:poly(3-hydroxybutyrate) depolymerase
MKKNILAAVSVVLLAVSAYSQPCGSNQNRYSDQPIFSAESIVELLGEEYGTANDYNGNPQTLFFDLYSPPETDPVNKRPLVILVHGGGFTQGQRSHMAGLCKMYARRGFVAATISYRLDPEVVGNQCSRPESQRFDATYRAIQDLNAALRYFTANAGQYRINRNWIFIGGSSAGGVTVLNTAYASQAELNAIDPTVETRLGRIDNSGNNLTNPFVIKGIHNDWGSVADSTFIDQGEGIPTISFHGLQDGVVPAGCNYPYGCSNYSKTCGSLVVHRVLTRQGVCSELNTTPNGGHGIYQDAAGKEYRVSRACCFFKGVMQCFSNTCQLGVWNTTQVPVDCSPSAARLATEETLSTALFYPNPASNSITIYAGERNTEIFVGIYDLTGREIIAVRNQYVVDISSLAAGTYMIRIIRDEESLSSLFIKE